MALTKQIKDLMTFSLPADWHTSRPDDTNQQSALDELTAGLTEEAYSAIAPSLQRASEEAQMDSLHAPDQLGAGADWSTPDNLAVLNIFADVVFYSNREIQQVAAFLASKGPVSASQVTCAGLALFSMFYSDRGGFSGAISEEETLAPTVCADPALLEAFHEMKATLANTAGESSEDFRVLSAAVAELDNKPAALVETEHYSCGVIDRQLGYHLLLNRERKDADWLVEEVHILLRCTPANFEYVSKDFTLFIESLRWLEHN